MNTIEERRKEIRDGLAQTLYVRGMAPKLLFGELITHWDDLTHAQRDTWLPEADVILSYLDDEGCVIETDERGTCHECGIRSPYITISLTEK